MSIITSTHGQLVINGKAVRDRDAMLASIAPEFSELENYEAGDYVIHGDEIRKFKEGGHSAGTWSDSDNDPATIDDVIGDITTSIDDKGVQVPDGTKLCEMPGYIGQIGKGSEIPTDYDARMYLYNNGLGISRIPLTSLGDKFVFSDRFELTFSPGDLTIDSNIDCECVVMERKQNIAWRYVAIRCFKAEYCRLRAHSRYDTSEAAIDYTDTTKKNYGMPDVYKIENDGEVLKLIVNGQTFNLYSYSTYGGADPQYQLSLFDDSANHNALCPNTKIYELKIYDGKSDNLKLWIRPCLRKNDNVPGVYDLVTNTFFTAANPSNLGISPA